MSVERRGNVYRVRDVSYRGMPRTLEITRNPDDNCQIADAPGLFAFLNAVKLTNREDLRDRLTDDLNRGIVTSTRVETDKLLSRVYHLRSSQKVHLAESFFYEGFETQSRALLHADPLDVRLTHFWFTDEVPKFEAEIYEQKRLRFTRHGVTASSNHEGIRYGLRIL